MAKTAMKVKQQRQRNSLREYIIVANLWTSSCIFKKIWYLPCLLP